MTIDSFASALREAISRQRPSTAPMKEGAFELRHVIKPAWSLAVRHPDVHVSVHPCPPREKCLDGCKGTVKRFRQVPHWKFRIPVKMPGIGKKMVSEQSP